LSATITDKATYFAYYSTYKMILKNKLDAGLSIKVDTSGTSGVTVKYAASSTTAEADMVDITSSAIINYSGQNLTVTLNDLKSIKDSNGNEIIAAGGIVYVTYNANFSDSLVYSNNGYASTLSVEYSNDPNDITSTAQTNEVSAKAFTYQLEVKNFEGAASDNKAYENAGFTLYKLNGSEETAVVDDVEKKGADLIWAGLDAGTYRLKQTTTATGYNTAKEVDFVISPTITKDSNDVYTLAAISATKVGETDSVEGFTGDASSAKLVYTIEHSAGALFPVSGGVGTTMFYLVGGCMIVAACVALTAYRKRRLARVIAGK
jgi:Fe-S cluster assembly iron-binding protein IscA